VKAQDAKLAFDMCRTHCRAWATASSNGGCFGNPCNSTAQAHHTI